MYTQAQKSISLVVLTSLLLQSCGTSISSLQQDYHMHGEVEHGLSDSQQQGTLAEDKGRAIAGELKEAIPIAPANAAESFPNSTLVRPSSGTQPDSTAGLPASIAPPKQLNRTLGTAHRTVTEQTRSEKGQQALELRPDLQLATDPHVPTLGSFGGAATQDDDDQKEEKEWKEVKDNDSPRTEDANRTPLPEAMRQRIAHAHQGQALSIFFGHAFNHATSIPDAIATFKGVAQVAPKRASKYLSLFQRKALQHPDCNTRGAAREALKALVRAYPQHEKAVFLHRFYKIVEEQVLGTQQTDKQLYELVKEIPELAEEAIDPLQKVLLDQQGHVRPATIMALQQVLDAAQGLANEDIFDMLHTAVGDLDIAVRCQAIAMLPRLARAEPTYAARVFPLLRDAIGDNHQEARQAALKALVDLCQAAPEYIDQIFLLLQGAVNDTNETVRIEALNTLVQVAQIKPDLYAEQAIALLHSVQISSCYRVNRSAGTALVALAKAWPQHVEAICLALIGAESSTNSYYYSPPYLIELIKALPQYLELIFPLLRDAVEDQNAKVACMATKALEVVLEVEPSYIDQVFPLLQNIVRDPNESVRCAAIRALRIVIESAPGYTEQVLPLFLDAARCNKGEVRRTAISALVTVTKLAPRHTGQTLPLLLEAVEKEGTRASTRVELQGLVKQVPRCIRQAFPLLQEAVNSPSWRIREVAVKLMHEVLSVKPEYVEQVLLALKDGIKDAKEQVCNATIATLVEIPKIEQEYWARICSLIMTTTGNVETRKRARAALVKFLREAPSRAPQIFIVSNLTDMLNGADAQIRYAIVSNCAALAKLVPRSCPIISAILWEAGNICTTTIGALKEVINVDPAYSDQAFEILHDLLQNNDAPACYAARDVLLECPRLSAGQVSALFQILRTAEQTSSKSVRIAARGVVREVLRIRPLYAARVFHDLQEDLKDQDHSVRNLVSMEIRQLAQLAPHYVPSMLALLEKRLNDTQPHVRHGACLALGRLAEVAPDSMQDIHRLLQIALNDRTRLVRNVAKNAYNRLR